MGSLSQAKTLGGVGAILLLLGAVPSVGPLLSIAGFILVLVAVKYIAEAVQNRAIFNNMIISVIMGIIGLVVFFILVLAALATFIGLPPPPGFFEPFIPPAGLEDIGADVLAFFAVIIIGLVITWIFFIISAVFLRKSFNTIASTLNVRMFGTAALVNLIGAFLLLILVGFALIFVAEILMVVAFFSIPDQAPQPAQMAPPPTETPP